MLKQEKSLNKTKEIVITSDEVNKTCLQSMQLAAKKQNKELNEMKNWKKILKFPL